MDISRRTLGLVGLLAFLGGRASDARVQGRISASPENLTHDMSSLPASWTGREQIAFLIYPQFTALDMAGPHCMLAGPKSSR
ncbi:hypothetical protein [Methylocapsa acidiphila]|uniref:hypothetical protein n=1 Tax=Methylocapsa acidiphila TaxID=133552 RepID=UPI00041E015F|nr:hypothetical protein [Methylocapsa acidiphila]